MSSSQRLVPLLAALGLSVGSISESLLVSAPVMAQTQGTMQLKLRRSSNSVEVVLEGVGQQPVLEQRKNGQAWEARLRTKGQPGLRGGAHQQVAMPELGLKYVSLSGADDNYQLNVVPLTGLSLSDPVVSSDGGNLVLSFSGLVDSSVQAGRVDLKTPGRVPQEAYVPPLRPGAVAPPLGDMAVGTMVLSNRNFLQISGPPVTLNLNNAPAKDALMSLAKLGGYGYVFVGQDPAESSDEIGNRPVSMLFQNETYARALNGVLLASGLQGKLEGQTLLVGSAVAAKTFGPQVSKVYRLNQASAASAADYLASLGASISKVNTVSITSGDSSSVEGSNFSSETSTFTEIETYGAALGPLKGLNGTTDSRLQTITLVGDSKLVAVAENYLKQIDLRSRQVALSVKILDVNLDNASGMNNSFSMRFGDNLIVNDNGQLLAAFGNSMPADAGTFGSAPVESQTSSSSTTSSWEQGYDYGVKYQLEPDGTFTGKISIDDDGNPELADALQYDGFGNLITNYGKGPTLYDIVGNSSESSSSKDNGTETRVRNPSTSYADQAFYDFLKAQIVSSNTKVMASPTLILSESSESIPGEIGRSKANEAMVTIGDKIITSYKIVQDDNGNAYCEAGFDNAGLTLGAMVSKIDDNGFVTFTLEPDLSAAVGQPVSTGGQCGNVRTVNSRRLETGAVRVRDGQTLILTGVISESDSQVITKWPILGDIPLIGQFFRSSNGTRRKNELVIMVTPRIINDDQGGAYGYGYEPSTQATRSLVYSR